MITMSKDISKLSEQQKALFDKVVNERKSVLFTGGAGTGKSFTLECIVQELRNKNESSPSVAVTACTGVAAFNVRGSTLHSFAGIQLGQGSKEELHKRASFNKKSAEAWKKVKTLIVDEVSMLDGDLFDKLEYIARKIRNIDKPFGGVQLVLVGDLLQLPPVSIGLEKKKRVFEAESWKECIQEYVLLKKVFRQQDMEFIRTLTCIRVGVMDDQAREFMKKLQEKKDLDEEAGIVELFATKDDTGHLNKVKLDNLEGDVKIYVANDSYNRNMRNTSQALDSCQAPYHLELKIGAQVMLVKNLNKELVNGTVGIVTGFTSVTVGNESTTGLPIHREQLPIVRFRLANERTYTRPMKREGWDSVTSSGQVQASREQIPLILAWAITIHKSQSQTIQRIRTDVSRVFESGQMYTALSRAVSADTLEVNGFDINKIKVDNVSLKFCLDNNLI